MDIAGWLPIPVTINVAREKGRAGQRVGKPITVAWVSRDPNLEGAVFAKLYVFESEVACRRSGAVPRASRVDLEFYAGG